MAYKKKGIGHCPFPFLVSLFTVLTYLEAMNSSSSTTLEE